MLIWLPKLYAYYQWFGFPQALKSLDKSVNTDLGNMSKMYLNYSIKEQVNLWQAATHKHPIHYSQEYPIRHKMVQISDLGSVFSSFWLTINWKFQMGTKLDKSRHANQFFILFSKMVTGQCKNGYWVHNPNRWVQTVNNWVKTANNWVKTPDN